MDMREREGTVVGGKWRIDREIGSGGTATVYAASHYAIGTRVALKVLTEEAAYNEAARARFLREGELANRVNHDGVIRVIDTGVTDDDCPFLVMELLEGETLDARRRKTELERLSIEESIQVSLALADILAAAHDAGIVHRDVKPANVFLTKQGGVKLLDFGVAGNEQFDGDDLTGAGCGTPLYMAPEQITGSRPIDARADIYALGAVAYLMLTGRRMFDTTEDFALTSKILNEEPPRVATVAPQPVPVELDLLVTACLEKSRDLRPQSVAGLMEALDALAVEHRWTQREARDWWAAISPPPA
jgi:serine/threonine protein kinase